MKRGLSLFLALLLMCAAPLAPAVAEAASPAPLTPVEQLVDGDGNVIFSDPIVEQGIRDCLMAFDGPVTKKQLAGMGSKYQMLYLSAPEAASVDLSLLQLCGKLKMLVLDGVTPANWDAIGALKSLTYFGAYRLALPDLRFLTGHKKLLDIALYDSTCADISAVTEIPKLYSFRAETPIADITPLLACKKLKAFTLAGLSDAQINALLDTLGKKLTDVGLTDCALSDETVQRIAALKLQGISLDNVALASVAPFFGMKSLRLMLGLANMDIPSLEGVQNLQKVQNVTLDNVTGVTDYAPLYQMAGIKTLNWSNSPAPDLTGIAGMKKLDALYLQNLSGTVTLAPVFGLGKLKTLGLYSVTVDSLAGVEGLAKLANLSMYDVQGISDYTPLSGLANIQSISTDEPEKMPAGLPVY
jgi:hypothetical protein